MKKHIFLLLALFFPAFAMASEIDHALGGLGTVIILGIFLIALLIGLAFLSIFTQAKWLKIVVLVLAFILFIFGILLQFGLPNLGIALCLVGALVPLMLLIKPK
ncbi:MAG: hypothetical protein ACPGWM_00590 [Flavobacteriales bacterium]